MLFNAEYYLAELDLPYVVLTVHSFLVVVVTALNPAAREVESDPSLHSTLANGLKAAYNVDGTNEPISRDVATLREQLDALNLNPAPDQTAAVRNHQQLPVKVDEPSVKYSCIPHVASLSQAVKAAFTSAAYNFMF